MSHNLHEPVVTGHQDSSDPSQVFLSSIVSSVKNASEWLRQNGPETKVPIGGEARATIACLAALDEKSPPVVLESICRAHPQLIETTDSRGVSLLMHACTTASLEKVRLLLELGANPCSENASGNTVLDRLLARAFVQRENIFVQRENTESNVFEVIAFEITKHERFVTAPNSRGETPLCAASGWGALEITWWLLNITPDRYIDIPDMEQRTPLYYAVIHNWRGVAEELVRRGAVMHSRENPNSPLVASIGDGTLDTLKMMLQLGAHADSLTDTGSSLLCIAAACEKPDALCCLLANGADPNNGCERRFGNSPYKVPLLSALSKERIDNARLLLEKGAYVDVREYQYLRTPLMESVRRGRADFASLFLLHGANVNSQDTDWNTALHLACEQVDVQQISLLLRESPQLELTNQKGETALSTLMAVDCFTRRHVSGPLSRATSLLTYAGASVWVGGRNLVHDAVKTRNADVVRSILSAANVENRSPQGLTPLQTATRHGAKLGIVKLLVEHGAAVNATAPGVGSALSFAASKCKLKVVEYLLKQRADTFLVHPTILASRGKSVEERSALELVAKFKERRYWELMLSMNMHANRAQNAQWEQPKRQKSGFESTDARSDKVACTWFELPELVIRLVARMLIDAETESRPTIQIRGPLHE